VVQSFAAEDPRVRGIRLARNSGSHLALTCAVHSARGECIIALAADLQDPPETIPALLEQWRGGAQVVWAVRGEREGVTAAHRGLSRLYYWLMRKVVGFEDMPDTGADFFLIDRRVQHALKDCSESNVSLLALITWLGFRQSSITYTKRARRYGESGWTLRKKLKLLVDSVTAFSYMPIRLMSYFGFLVAAIGFAFAAHIVYNAFTGDPPAGWTTLMVVLLVVGGIQMLMMGVLGEYLWRALDETRRRPRFIVEQRTDSDGSDESFHPAPAKSKRRRRA
jgi:dolichol-phosphate mannosyltransferase